MILFGAAWEQNGGKPVWWNVRWPVAANAQQTTDTLRWGVIPKLIPHSPSRLKALSWCLFLRATACKTCTEKSGNNLWIFHDGRALMIHLTGQPMTLLPHLCQEDQRRFPLIYSNGSGFLWDFEHHIWWKSLGNWEMRRKLHYYK